MAGASFSTPKLASEASRASGVLHSIYMKEIIRMGQHAAHLLYTPKSTVAPNRGLHINDITVMLQILFGAYAMILVIFFFEKYSFNYEYLLSKNKVTWI